MPISSDHALISLIRSASIILWVRAIYQAATAWPYSNYRYSGVQKVVAFIASK